MAALIGIESSLANSGCCKSGSGPIAHGPMKRSVLLTALVLAALLPASAHGQSEEPVLTGRAAVERMIGNTLVLAPKEPLPEMTVQSFIYFDPDGRASMQIKASERMNGTERTETKAGNWWVDDQERLCVVEEGKTLRDRDCLGMRVTGNVVQSVPEGIFHDSIAPIAKGNLHGL